MVARGKVCIQPTTRCTTHLNVLQDMALQVFYKAITNDKVTATPRPHNEDGYILMSAGWDGLYGTKDDVFNFAD